MCTKYFITVLLNWDTNKWFLFVIVSFLCSFQIFTNERKQKTKFMNKQLVFRLINWLHTIPSFLKTNIQLCHFNLIDLESVNWLIRPIQYMPMYIHIFMKIQHIYWCRWLLAYCFSQLSRQSQVLSSSVSVGMGDRISMSISGDSLSKWP